MMDDLVICIENCYILSDGKCFIKKKTRQFLQNREISIEASKWIF